MADDSIITVKYLRLGDPHKYSLADIDSVIKIMKTVTERVHINLSWIPDISSEKWAVMADNVGDIKELWLWNGVVGGGAEAVVGRLVSRVSAARLYSVKIVDFSCFADSLQVMLGEEGARCQKITFEWIAKAENKDKTVALGNTLGWTVKDRIDRIIISR